MRQLTVELREGVAIAAQLRGIEEAWNGGQWRSMLIHIYSGVPDEALLMNVAREIEAALPQAIVHGTMSAGEILNGKVIPRGIGISALLFERTDIGLLRFDDVDGHEVDVGRAVVQAIDAIPDLKAVELSLRGIGMDTNHMYQEISKARRGIQMFGGYPGGHQLNSPEHFIFNSREVMYNTLMVITYAGADFHIDVDKTIGWEPLGIPFKVTRAEGNHLIEINGKPAANVYEKFLQIDRTLHNNAEDAFEFPLLARDGDDERLRSTVHIEEDGSLYLHGFVTEGMEIQLSYGDPSTIVNHVNERLDSLRQFRPQVVLLYSCVVRKTFWESFVNMEMEPFEVIAPTAGFHTWGEIMRETNGKLVEHNITMLSIGMREGDPPAEMAPPVRVDDTILRGQASLLRRLTRLVYTSMEQLQKAHNRLTIMAERDALTDLYNRGKIEALIDAALNATSVNHTPVSLIMLDIDHFKHVNDTYGHETGDDVLRELAYLMRTAIAKVPGAQAGRWGGEEFFILMPGVKERQALDFAEDFRIAVDRNIFTGVSHMTISQGVITTRGTIDRQRVYTLVDNALYQAKEAGRNRVVQCEVE